MMAKLVQGEENRRAASCWKFTPVRASKTWLKEQIIRAGIVCTIFALALSLSGPVMPTNALDLECVSVQGKVADRYDRAIAGAKVELEQSTKECNDSSPMSATAASDGTWLIYAKRPTLPERNVSVVVTATGFDRAVGSMQVNLTQNDVPQDQVPASNIIQPWYTLLPQMGPHYVKAGDSFQINVDAWLPLPTDSPAGAVRAELADQSLVNLVPAAATGQRHTWSGSFTVSNTAAEGEYSFWVCAPKPGYSGRCLTATQNDVVSWPNKRVTYIIDTTPPSINKTSFVPGDGSTTIYTSQPIMVKVSDTLAKISTSRSQIVLTDSTAGTSKTISGFNLSYVNGWLKSSAQTLIVDHLYHVAVTAVDNAGNSSTATMKPVNEGGGFLVAPQTNQPTQASIAMTDCTLSPAAPGATTRTASCGNPPLKLDATNVSLGGSRQVGTGFVDQSVSLANLKITTLSQPALGQKVFSSNPPSRTQPTRFNVPEPFQDSRTLPIPEFNGALPGDPIMVEVPAVWANAQIFLDPVTTNPSNETCADPSSSTKSIYCMPDPLATRYTFKLKDAADVSATASAETQGSGCTVDAILGSGFTAICPIEEATKLASDSRNASGKSLLPETPTVEDPTFDANLEQLIQDQANAVGERFGGASWETGSLVTFRLTDSDVPAGLQNNAKVRIEQVQFSVTTLDATMDTVADQLNPLLAPGREPGTPGTWPWFARVDILLNKVVLEVDPAYATRDADIRNALANELTAGKVVLAYKPVLAIYPTSSTSCLEREWCPSPIRAGTIIEPTNDPANACTMGFTMVDPLGIRHVSTAGHCSGSPWWHSTWSIGSTVWSRNSGKVDFKVVRENNEGLKTPENYIFRPGAPNTPVTLKIVKPSATKGNNICFEGRVAGQQCGKMEDHNASMNGRRGFGQFTVPQVCGGDSGAPVINASNNRAYGLLSAARVPKYDNATFASGYTECAEETTVYFTWITEHEAASGYQVLTRPASDTLGPGQTLYAGDFIRSNNQRYELYMDINGNLIAYEIGVGIFWSSNTSPGSVAGYHAVMKNDGNFVIYDAGDHSKWSAGCCTAGTRIVIQDDRNIVMYRPNGSVAWASNTGR